MAHFVLEYSTNIPREMLSPVDLLGELVDAAVDTGLFPRAGCRGRAHPCDEFYVADGQATFAFVHLQVRLGAGRSAQEKAKAQEVLVAVLKAHLAVLYGAQGLAISIELIEMSDHKTNINNIRDYLELS